MSQRSVCTKSSLFNTNAKVLVVVRGFLNFHFFKQKSVLGSRDDCKMCAFLELECACPAAVENRHSQSHGIFILHSHRRCSYTMRQGLCSGRVSVRLFVRRSVSVMPTAAAACGGFAAVGPAARRYRSIAARPALSTAAAASQHGA